MNDEEALAVIRFVKVLFWVDFKNVITHLETNWFDFRGNIFTFILHVTKSLVRSAIKIWYSSCPFILNLFKYIRWNGKLTASGVNNGWV